MSSPSREIAALVVFVLLVVMSACGLGWYIFAGHSWNVAASNIDDTFGSMSGYTAIVYEGTVDPEEAASAAKNQRALSGSSSVGSAPGTSTLNESSEGSPAANGQSSDDANASRKESTESDAVSASDSQGAQEEVAGRSAASPATDEGSKGDVGGGEPSSSSSSSSASSPSSLSSSASTSGGSIEPAQPSASSGDSTDTGSPSEAEGSATTDGDAGGSSQKSPVSLDDVSASYVEKDASVLQLDTKNIDRYSEGSVIYRGGRRFGVFSVTKQLSPTALKAQIDYFKKLKVDSVIAITSDKTFLKGSTGIDIALCTQDEDLFVMGETENGTFYVDAPIQGSVGTILISPSGVVSAKVIDQL